MFGHQWSFGAAFPATLAALLLHARPAGAQAVGDPAQAGGYFVYGMIVLCGALLILMLRQSGRLRDAARDLRDARRQVEARDLVLSSDKVAALYFEIDPGSVTRRRLLRITPALRRLLALPQDEDVALDMVLDTFEAAAGANLRDRLIALNDRGMGFVDDFRARDLGRALTVSGERMTVEPVERFVDVIWFQDTSERIEKEQRLIGEIAQRQLFETIVGALPMPVWRRDENHELVYRNPSAVALMANEDPSQRVAQRAVRTNRAQSESIHVVVAGDRRLFEFSEWPMPDGSGMVGWATDVTTLEAIQTDLARLVAVHEEVLEELSTAIAIFGQDKRLGYFNTAFSRLWKIETDLLRDEPTVSEFLNLLRERRRLPEQSDFAAFRDQWNQMFTRLIGPRQELLFLPDETTLRMVAAAHPNGGLLLTFEDVTDRLVLERSYNVLSAVQGGVA